MKRFALVTFSRAEVGSIAPVLQALNKEPGCEAKLIVSGTHLSPWHGSTVMQIEADHLPIEARAENQLASDSGEGVAKSVGVAMISLAQLFAQKRPDMLVLAGDRTELLAAATVALSLSIPVAHISGGEITEYASDNQIRHAVSKMSHLHFVGMPEHAVRLCQMGEESWRVNVTGDPALDVINALIPMTRSELAADLGMELKSPVVVLTYHPTTLAATDVANEIDALLRGLAAVAGSIVVTAPNADVGGHIILSRLRNFVASRRDCGLFTNLGQRRYYSLLATADVMIGNSSSGIWEAPSFALPVVNVGDRQRGRTRAGNVIDVSISEYEIFKGIERALEPAFRRSLHGMKNPYGDGLASARIAHVLASTNLDSQLLVKRFIDHAIPTALEADGDERHALRKV